MTNTARALSDPNEFACTITVGTPEPWAVPLGRGERDGKLARAAQDRHDEAVAAVSPRASCPGRPPPGRARRCSARGRPRRGRRRPGRGRAAPPGAVRGLGAPRWEWGDVGASSRSGRIHDAGRRTTSRSGHDSEHAMRGGQSRRLPTRVDIAMVSARSAATVAGTSGRRAGNRSRGMPASTPRRSSTRCRRSARAGSHSGALRRSSGR